MAGGTPWIRYYNGRLFNALVSGPRLVYRLSDWAEDCSVAFEQWEYRSSTEVARRSFARGGKRLDI